MDQISDRFVKVVEALSLVVRCKEERAMPDPIVGLFHKELRVIAPRLRRQCCELMLSLPQHLKRHVRDALRRPPSIVSQDLLGRSKGEQDGSKGGTIISRSHMSLRSIPLSRPRVR